LIKRDTRDFKRGIQKIFPMFKLTLDSLGKAVGEMIRKDRENQGLSQAALSKRARTTQAVISLIENLNAPYILSVGVLARLAGALGAHIEISFIPGERTISSEDRLRVSSGT